MVLPSRPPPEDGPLPLSPAPPEPTSPPQSPLPPPPSPQMEGSKCAGAAAAAASLPGVCPRPGRPAGQEGERINTPPAPPATARRSARPTAGTWGAPAAPSVGRGGDWRGWRGADYGDGVVPAADGVRTREVGREMSPHRASLARSCRRRQRRRRHLHFCPSFSVSQAPLPSGGGGANGGRRAETGGRGHGCEGAGLRETGAQALSIGRLNVVGPRRCKARADWSVRAPGGWDSSRLSVRRARVREAGGGGARPPAREGVLQEPACVSPGRWEGSGAPALSLALISLGQP